MLILLFIISIPVGLVYVCLIYIPWLTISRTRVALQSFLVLLFSLFVDYKLVLMMHLAVVIDAFNHVD